MKRTFLAFAVLLGFAVCVSSCSKEDYEEDLYEETEVPASAGAVRSHGGGGTVEKAIDSGMQEVGAINAFMKICGPDINGGSSS